MGLVWSSASAQPMVSALSLRAPSFLNKIASGMKMITAPQPSAFHITPMMMLFGSIRDKHQRHFRNDSPAPFSVALPPATKTWTVALNTNAYMMGHRGVCFH